MTYNRAPPPSVSGSGSGSGLNGNRVQMHAVVPLLECPHLPEVNCGRYVAGHAVHHQASTGHSMVLSLTDLSVWCYPCESYVHNEILIPAKNAAHRSKFGVTTPEQGALPDTTSD